MNEPTIALIIAVVIFSCFFISLRRSLKKRDMLLNEEKSKEPVLIEIGGGRFEQMYYSRPYVKLRLYDEFLVISYKKKILLRYDKIDDVKLINWRSGLEIYHNDASQPIEKIVFFSKSADYLSALIKEKVRAYRNKGDSLSISEQKIP
jgi:hypothetical protein